MGKGRSNHAEKKKEKKYDQDLGREGGNYCLQTLEGLPCGIGRGLERKAQRHCEVQNGELTDCGTVQQCG